MAIDVRTTIDIDRPAREVAAYAFEPSNDSVWIGGIAEARLLTGRPVGRGTQVRRVAQFLGKTIDYILEVVEFGEDRLMVMRSVKSPFPMTVTYRFDSMSEHRTRAEIHVEGSPKGWYAVADFLMAPMVKKISQAISTV